MCMGVYLCVSVDPVINCYGPEGWPDIKALNDAIYYVHSVCLCVCGVGCFIALLPHVFVVWGTVSGVLLSGSIALGAGREI